MGNLKETKDKSNTRRKDSNKKTLAAAALLLAICLCISSGAFMKGCQDNDHEADVAYLPEPKLPRISFLAEGKEINSLTGYTDDMDVAALRDMITPVPENGALTVIVKNMPQSLTKLDYEVYSLDGERLIWRDTSPVKEDGTAALDLKDVLPATDLADRERVLSIILELGEEQEKRRACYFTRIISDKDLSLKQCMDFAEDFHNKTFDKRAREELSRYTEPDMSADNNTLAHVTIHCDIDQVTWGKMSLNVPENIEWRITETNPVYTSLQAVYKVKSAGESGQTEYFNVKEFFRVRCLKGEMYLLNYDRTMGRIFVPEQTVLTEEGIFLGIAPEDTEYAVSPGGKAAAFVSEGTLWLFDRETAQIYLVFGFTDGKAWDRYAIRIIGMDESGNMVFAVYGYMDRGNHEGRVGAAVCYFDIEKNAVEEKAFIPSSKSHAIVEREFGKMMYYAHEREMLYVISGGKLFEIDLEENSSKILDADLSKKYIVSGDGHLLAFQTGEEIENVQAEVMDFKTGKTTLFKAPRGEKISVLGFIKNDIIYGLRRPQDMGKTSEGEEISPIYKLEIADTAGSVAKEYSAGNMYICGVDIEENFVTIRRVRKDSGVYTKCEDDHITDTAQRVEHGIALKSFYAEPGQRQILLTLPEDMSGKELKMLKSALIPDNKNIPVLFESETSGEVYYVYGLGELQGVYYNIVKAINEADAAAGVVISKDQSYVWERGNRDLIYYTEAEEFTSRPSKSSLDACIRALDSYEGKMTDLTGCTLKQIYYIINRRAPVVMKIDSKNAVLITGYSTINVEYIDPADGKRHYADNEEMEEMARRGGNVFMGKPER